MRAELPAIKAITAAPGGVGGQSCLSAFSSYAFSILTEALN